METTGSAIKITAILGLDGVSGNRYTTSTPAVSANTKGAALDASFAVEKICGAACQTLTVKPTDFIACDSMRALYNHAAGSYHGSCQAVDTLTSQKDTTVTVNEGSKTYRSPVPGRTWKDSGLVPVESTNNVSAQLPCEIGSTNHLVLGSSSIGPVGSPVIVGGNKTIIKPVFTKTIGDVGFRIGVADSESMPDVSTEIWSNSDVNPCVVKGAADENNGTSTCMLGSLGIQDGYSVNDNFPCTERTITISPTLPTIKTIAGTKVYDEAASTGTYAVSNLTKPLPAEWAPETGEVAGNYAARIGALLIRDQYSITEIPANVTNTWALSITNAVDDEPGGESEANPNLIQ
jgi:hypothetical protein